MDHPVFTRILVELIAQLDASTGCGLLCYPIWGWDEHPAENDPESHSPVGLSRWISFPCKKNTFQIYIYRKSWTFDGFSRYSHLTFRWFIPAVVPVLPPRRPRLQHAKNAFYLFEKMDCQVEMASLMQGWGRHWRSNHGDFTSEHWGIHSWCLWWSWFITQRTGKHGRYLCSWISW